MKTVTEVTPKRLRRKRGIAPLVLVLASSFILGLIFFFIWLFRVVGSKEDFDHPWWHWVLLILVILIVFTLLFGGTYYRRYGRKIQGSLPKGISWKLPNIEKPLRVFTMIGFLLAAIAGTYFLLNKGRNEAKKLTAPSQQIIVQRAVRNDERQEANEKRNPPPEGKNFTIGERVRFKAGTRYYFTRGGIGQTLCFDPDDLNVNIHVELPGSPWKWDLSFDATGNIHFDANAKDDPKRAPRKGWFFTVDRDVTMMVYVQRERSLN